MLRSYLDGSVAQTTVRAKQLIGRIPRDLPRHYSVLEQTCRYKINVLINELDALSADRVAADQAIRLRQFRRVIAELDLLEGTAFRALVRTHRDDHHFNWLLERIKREIHFPLPTPVVSALSQEYFQIEPTLNLLFVPLSEVDFLLHLPDLYHELAHPLLTTANDPRLEPLQTAWYSALESVLSYVEGLERQERRRHGPASYQILVDSWTEGWCPHWLNELFCDAYATYTAGPAYGWSHLHLSAKRGRDPFEVLRPKQSHPADDARMRLVLCCLERSNLASDAAQVKSHWHRLLAQAGARPEPEYERCYPEELLGQVADKAQDGVRGIGARLAGPGVQDELYCLLNAAWLQFWTDPAAYPRWESQAVRDLYAKAITE